jgi:hypothetical protein
MAVRRSSWKSKSLVVARTAAIFLCDSCMLEGVALFLALRKRNGAATKRVSSRAWRIAV